MRLALHHLENDLRAIWPLLVLWTGILAIRLLLPVEELLESPSRAERAQAILMTTQWALTALLPAMLILKDPVRGARAFWLTRPISRLDLLASKALGLGLFFVALPLAFHLASLLRAGLTGWALAAGLAEAAIHLAGVVLAVAALASVSSSLARFVVLLVVCVLCTKFVGPTLVEMSLQSASGVARWPSLSKSREVAEMALLLLAGAGILCHHFLTRQSNRSFALVGVAVLALSWIPSWSLDFLAPEAPPLEGPVELELEAPAFEYCSSRGPNHGRVELCGRFLFDNLDTSLDLEIERIDSRLLFPDGRSISHREGGLGGWLHDLVVGRNPQAVAGVVQTWPSREAHYTLLNPSDDLYREYAGVAGRFEAEILVAVFEERILGTLPIETGARFRAGATAATLERIAIASGRYPAVHLFLRLRWADLLFAPKTWSRPLDATFEHRVAEQPGHLNSSGSGGPGPFFVLPRPRLYATRSEQTLIFDGWSLQDSAGSILEPPSSAEEVREWLDDAEFVLHDRVRRGSYRGHVQLEGFRMADYAQVEEG